MRIALYATEFGIMDYDSDTKKTWNEDATPLDIFEATSVEEAILAIKKKYDFFNKPDNIIKFVSLTGHMSIQRQRSNWLMLDLDFDFTEIENSLSEIYSNGDFGANWYNIYSRLQKDALAQYELENPSLDSVLDKIHSEGIDSLNEYELRVLKQNSI